MSKEKILSTTKFMDDKRKREHLIRRLYIARCMQSFSSIKLFVEIINELDNKILSYN
jgi:hypothetical protein